LVVGSAAAIWLEILLHQHAHRVAATIKALTAETRPDRILAAHQPIARALANALGANVDSLAWDPEPNPSRRARYHNNTILIRRDQITNRPRLNATLVHDLVHAAQHTALSDPNNPTATLWTRAITRWRASLTGPGQHPAALPGDQYRNPDRDDPDPPAAWRHRWATMPHVTDARIVEVRFGEILADTIRQPPARGTTIDTHPATITPTTRRLRLHQALRHGTPPTTLINAITPDHTTTGPALVDAAILLAFTAAQHNNHQALDTALSHIAVLRTSPDTTNEFDPANRYDWITTISTQLRQAHTPPATNKLLTTYLAICAN